MYELYYKYIFVLMSIQPRVHTFRKFCFQYIDTVSMNDNRDYNNSNTVDTTEMIIIIPVTNRLLLVCFPLYTVNTGVLK